LRLDCDQMTSQLGCHIAALLRSAVSPFSIAGKVGIALAECGSVRSRMRAGSVTSSISQSRSVDEDNLARFILVEGDDHDVVLDERLDAYPRLSASDRSSTSTLRSSAAVALFQRTQMALKPASIGLLGVFMRSHDLNSMIADSAFKRVQVDAADGRDTGEPH